MANTKAFLEGSFFSEKHGGTGTQSGEIGYNGRTEGWQESAGVGGPRVLKTWVNHFLWS